jgi:predicted ATP-grasp superfamily ATP-dependent carboligase
VIGAVVFGGDYRGLGIVRSLGRHGVPVCVVRAGSDFQASLSRYAQSTAVLSKEEAAHPVPFLIDLAERRGLEGWALYPTTDESAVIMSRHHEELSKLYLVTVPPWETFEIGFDKRATYRLAGEIGLEYPRTAIVGSRAELERLDLDYPLILKPAFREEINRLTLDKAWRADDEDELLKRYDEASALVGADAVLVQELIPGDGSTQLSFAALCVDGRPLASVTACRVRQYPMDFGRASTYVVSIDDADVEAQGTALLERLGLTGLAEVEFKRDPRSGRLKLLDLNLRVWAWHTLARRGGVDFAYLLWQALHGIHVDSRRTRAGVSWMRMSTDLPTALGEIRHGNLSVRDYLRSFSPPRERAVLARDDPMPAFSEAPGLAYRVARRLARGERA